MKAYISALETSLGRDIALNLKEQEFEICGTVYDAEKRAATVRATESSSENVILQDDAEQNAKLLNEADLIVFPMFEHPKDAVKAIRMIDFSIERESERKFIGISTVMTWSKNPAPSEDSNGFSEDNYKQRKPSRKYAEYKSAETQIIGSAREGFNTCVVAAGLLYGGAQTDFQYLFREAWLLNQAQLPIPSLSGNSGSNYLPTISIYDVSQIVCQLATMAPPKQYIIAVDKSSSTLKEIAQCVSNNLGTGKIRELTAEEAESITLEEPTISSMQVDMRFDIEGSALEQMGLDEEKLKHMSGLPENIKDIAADYVTSMDLRPLRIAVIGPPRAGKTTAAESLSKRYKLPLLNNGTIVDHFLKQELSDDLSESEKEAYSQISGHKEKNEVIPDDLLCTALKNWLREPECRNQGYVLDGLPTSFEQAGSIFSVAGEDNEDEEPAADGDDADDESAGNGSVTIAVQNPNRALIFDAEDAILVSRVQKLDEEEAARTQNTEAEYNKRLSTFREEMDAENPNNLAIFFEKRLGIDVLEMNTALPSEEANQKGDGEEDEPVENEDTTVDEDNEEKDNDAKESVRQSIQMYIEAGGKPFNFHPTKAEIEEEQRLQREKEELEKAAFQKAREEEVSADAVQREAQMAQEKLRLEMIQKEEVELLEERSKPLRNYLMETVIPSLTEGMLEVIKVKPADPADFLADFLFKKGQELEALTIAEENNFDDGMAI